MLRLTSYDINLILCAIKNKMQDTSEYNYHELIEDYTYLYNEINKFLLTGGNLNV